MITRGISLVALAVLVAGPGACVNPVSDREGTPGEAIGGGAQDIIDGTPATSFPEAVQVDIQQNGQTTMGCSGTVIAPRVVLTAGHCGADGDGWNVRAPYASGQTAHGSSSASYDWTQHDDQVSPQEHDVALVFLDSPITLSSYPTIATTGLADQAQIITLGRVKGGQGSPTAIYQSQPVKVTSSTYGFEYDYEAPIVIEHGDSGGAGYSAGTHTIVSVNSTGNSTVMEVARVDLVSSWIAQQIASHGGGGGQGGGGGGQGGSGAGGGGEGGSTGEGGGPGWPTGGGPGWPPGGGPGWPPGGGPGWPPGGGPGWPPGGGPGWPPGGGPR